MLQGLHVVRPLSPNLSAPGSLGLHAVRLGCQAFHDESRSLRQHNEFTAAVVANLDQGLHVARLAAGRLYPQVLDLNRGVGARHCGMTGRKRGCAVASGSAAINEANEHEELDQQPMKKPCKVGACEACGRKPTEVFLRRPAARSGQPRKGGPAKPGPANG